MVETPSNQLASMGAEIFQQYANKVQKTTLPNELNNFTGWRISNMRLTPLVSIILLNIFENVFFKLIYNINNYFC